MMDGMMGGWMMLWGVLGFLLVLGLVVVIVLAIFRMARPGSGSSGTSGESAYSAEPPLEILQRRLAQGEITPEQFEAMKHQIQEKER